MLTKEHGHSRQTGPWYPPLVPAFTPKKRGRVKPEDVGVLEVRVSDSRFRSGHQETHSPAEGGTQKRGAENE